MVGSLSLEEDDTNHILDLDREAAGGNLDGYVTQNDVMINIGEQGDEGDETEPVNPEEANKNTPEEESFCFKILKIIAKAFIVGIFKSLGSYLMHLVLSYVME